MRFDPRPRWPNPAGFVALAVNWPTPDRPAVQSEAVIWRRGATANPF